MKPILYLIVLFFITAFIPNRALGQKINIGIVQQNWVVENNTWLPKIGFNIKSTSNKDQNLFIKLRFIDHRGRISCDKIIPVSDLPAQQTKGPFLESGDKGFNARFKFPLSGSKEEWKYILYKSNTYNGKYKKVFDGIIPNFN